MTCSLSSGTGNGELGVAVQSRAFGVALCVGSPGVGAVATQAFTERGYGPAGSTASPRQAPADALADVLADDELSAFRQVGIIGPDGAVAQHTGASCVPAAGHASGENWAAQGNMLASPAVWFAAADTFESTQGSLAERLLAALDAAEEAGGDFRGSESAARRRLERPEEELAARLRPRGQPPTRSASCACGSPRRTSGSAFDERTS
jgi:uncharacterized Ntn-hydrolase superfamily protein